MAGLDDLDPSNPAGDSLLSFGDDAIRLITTKLIEAFTLEHAGSGGHALLVGTIAQRPAPSGSGRLYILTVAGVAAELQFDTGSAWTSLSQNQTIITYAGALSSHINAAVIDHPDNSVTSAKIKAGQILKKHLMGGVSADTLELLVNGGDANPLHRHTWESQFGMTGNTIYDTAGPHTLIAPEGVVRMLFCLVGGGGAGGAGYGIKGGGGGASGTIVWMYPLTVTPLEELDLHVGAGGIGNNNREISGGNGVNTTVERIPLEAIGGNGGNGGYTYADASFGGVAKQGFIASYGGGSGGYNPFSGTKVPATNGGSSAWYNGGTGLSYDGGGGGASIFGHGKNGGGAHQDGVSASDMVGSGSGSGVGGGGGGRSGSVGTYGGNGDSGRIMVIW